MAKKMSKRKTNAIVLGVTLTLVMVLLGGVIAAVVTETNPKDWFKQEIKYSTYGEEITKEYNAFYFDATEETVNAIFDAIAASTSESAYLATFGDGSDSTVDQCNEMENGYLLGAFVFELPEGDSPVEYRFIMLMNIETQERKVIYSNKDFDGMGDGMPACKAGFQNLGEDGRLEWNGEAITGAIYLDEQDVEISYNGISITPIK